MLSRCLSSIYRSINQICFNKTYNLLSRTETVRNNKYLLSKFIHETSTTFSLSLFLFYIIYQLFGSLIFILFTIYGTLFSLYCLQDLLLYQPNEPDTSRTIVLTPNMYHMPYESVTIETADNEKLHGYLIKQPQHTNECPTLIFFHGNAGNIGHRLQNAYLLYRSCHINILLFDYRGYGKSSGIPSETGLYMDGQAVYEYARSRADLNQEKIFFFGRSLGGAVALHLASQLSQDDESPQLYCVIVENTFTSIPDMGKRLFSVFLLDYIPLWCYKNLFLSISKIRYIDVPVLFISGEQDELVPPHMMQRLHDECRSRKKKLALFFDGQHNTTWLSPHYADQIYRFLNECSLVSEAS